MARIRSVKPEFWTDERLVECSRDARLFFIAVKNFMDDYGRIEFLPKSIKMKVFPADDLNIEALAQDLCDHGVAVLYEVDGRRYFADTTWADTQKIDSRAPEKLPAPPNPASSRRIPSMEGNGIGVEGKGHEPANAGLSKPAVPPCPHQEIIALYAKHLPMGRQPDPELWTGTRADHLKARWRENQKRQTLEWWEKFFGYCAQSDFLTGKVPPQAGRKPFELSLDWIVMPTNFASIHEGKYS